VGKGVSIPRTLALGERSVSPAARVGLRSGSMTDSTQGPSRPARPGLLARLANDAVELARVAERLHGGTPGLRSVAREILTTDSFQLLALWRLRERARALHIPGVNHLLRRTMSAVYGLEVGNAVTLGYGVNFVHPVGIVIGGDAKVGNRVKFMGSNTVGTAKENGHPVIEDDVIVGAGARILGPIRIGARAIIGANAVVLEDVPPDTVVVGIPARPAKPPRSGGNGE
jgi:serine O-acetyltransferase